MGHTTKSLIVDTLTTSITVPQDDFATADLYDVFLDKARIPGSGSGNIMDWRHYGGKTKFAGYATTVKCFEDNSRLQELALSAVPSTSTNAGILVVDAGASRRCAIMGDQIAQTAMSNGWKGVIISGCVRDVSILKEISMGIMALGSTPRKSTRRGEGQVHIPIQLGDVVIQPGDLIFADDDGILVLDPIVYREQQQEQQKHQKQP
mmetsp:Transcript_15613/g.20349  ORF Transcript_15613/g.20349 Transcript_15613/m.20349 type:complete len:206 (-) Transcript_15613:30-647(-)